MRFLLLLGLLLGAAAPSSSQDITIIPNRNPVVIPSLTHILMPGIPLICGLNPDTLEPNVNYTTRWILPNGQTITSSQGRFVFSESRVSFSTGTLPGTILVVTSLSYQDAGTYTCEGRSTAPGASPLWASASFELQLNLELLSDMSTINATMSDSMVALECEMRAFIRPDSSLIWEGPGGQRIAGGTGKHQITFSDGSPSTAANGGRELVPSRVSTLVISNPEPSDAGTYTCRVVGATNPVIAIDLLVDIEGPDTISTTRFDTQAESTTPSSAPSSPQDITIIPSRNPVVIPSLIDILSPGIPLICGLNPDTLEPNVNYTTRWILPDGQIITSSQGRFVFTENRVSLSIGQVPGTILVVTGLSFQDAGTYTCEGRSTAPGASPLWASASIELQLNLELLSTVSTINATMSDSTVALGCEMRAFIRPDSSLIWEGPGGQRIAGGTGKHQITFSDGSQDAAANGGEELIPSRVSTLVISNPEPSDAGTYTCRVVEVTNAVIAIDLLVDIEGPDIISTTRFDTQAESTTPSSPQDVTIIETRDIISTTRFDTQAESTTINSSSNPIFPVIGAILGSVAIIIVIV